MRARLCAAMVGASILFGASAARADDPPPLPDQTEQGEVAEKSAEVQRVPLAPSTSPHSPRNGEHVTVYETKRGRLVVVVVTPPPPPHGPMGPPPPMSPRRSVVPWVVTGVGALLVTTAVVFELVALNEDTQAKNLAYHLILSDPTPATRAELDSSRESHRDAAKTNEAIAITVGAIGLATLATGVTWLILSRTRTAAPAPPPVAFQPRPGGAGLSFSF